MLSVQTNVTSLIAQNNLRVDTDFQSRTIQRLTSGYRINSSGDDPAGLAVANGYRDSEAELTQGIQNANDGISTLQIIDGGMNNIGQILDRLQTLATQSASDTFTGSRDVLNSEFQGLVTEINRQAQSIGLDQNGAFAKALSVYIGGGRAQGTTTAATNSSVQLNLSGATVDAKSLGLTGMQALAGTAGTTDIGDTSSNGTTVSDILSDSNNHNTGATTFYISGPGFSGAQKEKVSVNLQNVTDTGTLITAINKGLQNAGNDGTAAGSALQAANITATMNTDSTGKQQLAFTSSTTGFQVEAGDLVSNALMGNFAASTGADAKAMTSTFAGGENVTTADTIANPGGITVQFTGAGLASPVNITLNSSDATVGDAISDLQTQMATKLSGTGITLATPAASGQKLTFSNSQGEQFSVAVTGDTQDALGFGSFQTGANSAFDYSTLTAATTYDPTAATDAGTAALQFSINGAASGSVTVDLAGGNATAASVSSQAVSGSTMTIDTANDQLNLAVDGTVYNVTLPNGTTATKANTAANAGFAFGATSTNTITITAATSGAETGSNVGAGPFDTTTKNQFTVSIDGGAAQTINLVAASGQSGSTIATEIQSQLGGAATATWDSVNDKFVITSASTGLTSSIQIGAGAAGGLGTGDATTLLGLDTTKHSGVAGNNLVNVSVDGGATQTITLTAGTNRTQTQILADLNGSSLGTIATVSGATNTLTLSSTTSGPGSSITVTAPAANSAVTALGLTAAVSNGTYHGAAATDVVTLSSVADAIQTAVGSAATVSVVNNGTTSQLQIQDANKGVGHTIEVLAGSSNSVLGGQFTAGTTANGTNMSGANLAAALQQAIDTGAQALSDAGLTATWNTSGPNANTITISSSNGTNFRVNAPTDSATNATSLSTASAAHGGTIDLTGNNSLTVNGKSVTLTSGTMTATAIAGAINGTSGVGVHANVVSDGGTNRDFIQLVSTGTAGASDAITVSGSAATLLGLSGASGTAGSVGFGSTGVTFGGPTDVSAAKNSVVNAGGSSNTGDLAFKALAYGSDSQVITLSATDSAGAQQSTTVTLANTGATRNGQDIDQAIQAINTALQQSNNPTMQKITAVKDDSSGTQMINFISSLPAFQVSLGSTASGDGVGTAAGSGAGSQGTTVASTSITGGSSLDISSQQGGSDAISAITNAVSALGSAQANVGKAQNTLNYAIGLAESQMSNLSAAESRIRDADMASEAANLTKAQVLQQSAIAAMVQANSAPQVVLTLLRG